VITRVFRNATLDFIVFCAWIGVSPLRALLACRPRTRACSVPCHVPRKLFVGRRAIDLGMLAR
jgi:hypothetical protein